MSIVEQSVLVTWRKFGRAYVALLLPAVFAAVSFAAPARAPIEAPHALAVVPTAAEAPFIIQSLGYVEFDFIGEAVPGFAPWAESEAAAAPAQTPRS